MDLKTWMSVSRRRSNFVALTLTAILMGSLFFRDYGPSDSIHFVRGTALFMIVMHGLFHGMSIFGLRAMMLRGVEDAELALSFYQHPRRLSHLDLAVSWIGLYSAAPYVL